MFSRNNLNSAIEQNPKTRVHFSYWILVTLRFLLALVPQNGYIHPDEFFQTLEPIAGDVLDIDSTRCWEFNVTFPLRNIALSRLTIGIPLVLLQNVNALTIRLLNIDLQSPYFIIIFPRIFYCLLSFINDYCLYKICQLYGQNHKTRLIMLASSHVIFIYATRTFSNSLEMILLSILMLLVSECMHKSDCIIYYNEYLSDEYDKSKNIVDRVKFYKLRNTLPAHSLSKCLQIATVAVIGIFNRPTFIGFAFPSVFFWLFRGLGTKFIGFKDFHTRMFILVMCSLPAIIFLILIDSFYYGYLTLAEIHSLEVTINNFVVTPFNFLKYNLLAENLAEHGLHPRWLHILVNIPLLFNVLGIAGLLYTIRMCYRVCKGSYSAMPRLQSITGLMIFSFITPVALLSMFPHQEPRFLIPILLPTIFLFTHFIQSTNHDSKQLKTIKFYAFILWFVFNLLFTVFFGFIHQGGVYFVAKHFHSELKAKPRGTTIHLVTSHLYNIPQSLFQAESTSTIRTNRDTGHKYRLAKQIFLYELGSKSLDDVLNHVKILWKVNEARAKDNKNYFRLYLVIPASLKSDLGNAWYNANATALSLKEEMKFYPHLSTEAFPYVPSSKDQSCYYESQFLQNVSWKSDLTLLDRLKCFMQQFSLVLYKIDISSYLTIENIHEEYYVKRRENSSSPCLYCSAAFEFDDWLNSGDCLIIDSMNCIIFP